MNLSDLGGFREFVRSKTGEVVEPGEENQYSTFLDAFMRDPSNRKPVTPLPSHDSYNLNYSAGDEPSPKYDAAGPVDDTNQKGATGGTFTGEDLDQFQELLNSLTSSKMTQQKQKSKEDRKSVYAGGMANMMRNF